MKKGFSLLEMVVYVALVAMLGVILIQFVLSISFGFNRAKVKREVFANTRLAMEYMLQDIRAAQGIYTPASQFDVPLGVLSLATTVDLPADEKVTYIDYFVSSSQLWLKAESQPSIALTSPNVAVTGLSFHRFYNASLSAEAVQVRLTVVSITDKPNLAASTTLISTATLRAGENN